MQCFKLSSKYKSMWYIRETTHIYLSRRFNSLHQTEKDQNPGKKQADDIFQTDFVDMVQRIGLVFTEYKTSEKNNVDLNVSGKDIPRTSHFVLQFKYAQLHWQYLLKLSSPMILTVVHGFLVFGCLMSFKFKV